MIIQFLSLSLTTTTTASLLVLLLFIIITSYLFLKHHLIPKANSPSPSSSQPPSLPDQTPLIQALCKALPPSTILPSSPTEFAKAINAHWAQQENENIPACIIRPSSTTELCTAVKILKSAFDESRETKSRDDEKNENENEKERGKGEAKGLFAIRSGGHSPVSGAASMKDGIVIDLSLFNEITVAEDKKSVRIGAGCKWGRVSRILDARGLAVVGGRNSDVGVGGLILGGGISFFTPRYGLVCSNILIYEIVLANGSLITASPSSHPDLFKALKGGGNNFGIVTSFTARCFPGSDIWAGFIYLPGFQARKVLHAFHDEVKRADYDGEGGQRDEFAAGPIVSFSYVARIGIQVVAAQMCYTAPPPDHKMNKNKNEKQKQWPQYWKKSKFARLWRIWSTCKTQSLTSATDELSSLNPPGRRQIFATCTIKNDMPTILSTYKSYLTSISAIKNTHRVKGLIYTLILQPFLPSWAVKGHPNLMGFSTGSHDNALVNVSFTVNWDEAPDDGFVKKLVRDAVGRIEGMARERGMGHKWVYLNYCATWQSPFEGYGEGAREFLREVAGRVDPEGFFQRACVGGFKIGEGE